MKKIFTLSLFVLAIFATVNAQKFDGSIKGKLMDTAAKQPIVDATVSVLNAKDSSLATFTLSNKQGAFEVKGLGEGDYRVIVSSKGYMEFKKTVSITATQKLIDFGNLSIEKIIKHLKGLLLPVNLLSS
ncbi:MAG: carboxypeptidase regulatory-like domain-containing protein [Chitinophagaceae bacterium]|nr:carboxypeptidase regulatory-like domain-containing protein [Chitinophagaceae bacterium]